MIEKETQKIFIYTSQYSTAFSFIKCGSPQALANKMGREKCSVWVHFEETGGENGFNVPRLCSKHRKKTVSKGSKNMNTHISNVNSALNSIDRLPSLFSSSS